jgi:T-complex protein 1 subunit theta
VTSDCITIVEQLSVEHPAAKILIHAAAMQEREIGDGSNLVVIFGGELLKKAETLIKMGIHTADIVIGFRKSLEILEN